MLSAVDLYAALLQAGDDIDDIEEKHEEYLYSQDKEPTEDDIYEVNSRTLLKAHEAGSQQIVEHLLQTGQVMAAIIVPYLNEHYPEPGELRTALVKQWFDTLITFRNAEAIVDFILEFQTEFVENELLYGYFVASLEYISDDIMDIFFQNNFVMVLHKVLQTHMLGNLTEPLKNKGIEPMRVLKLAAGHCYEAAFYQVLQDNEHLKNLFESEHTRFEVLKAMAHHDNLELLKAFRNEFENQSESEYKMYDFLLEGVQGYAYRTIDYIIASHIKNQWAIDERCLLANPALAAHILRRNLRIKGGTLVKIKQEHNASCTEILRSLIENASREGDPTRELRIKALTDPNGQYQYPATESMLDLAKMFEKQNIITILEKHMV